MLPEIGWLLRRLAAKRVPPAVGEVQCIPIEYDPPKFLSRCSERIRVLSRGAFNCLGSFFQQRLDWPYILNSHPLHTCAICPQIMYLATQEQTPVRWDANQVARILPLQIARSVFDKVHNQSLVLCQETLLSVPTSKYPQKIAGLVRQAESLQ
jgi:hypothetical protein